MPSYKLVIELFLPFLKVRTEGIIVLVKGRQVPLLPRNAILLLWKISPEFTSAE